MADTVEAIDQTCRRLRVIQADTLAPMPQAAIVETVSAWAGEWRRPASPWRREAEALTEPFPFAMTRISLDALLESLTPDALWSLIDAEGVRDAHGAALIGHVVAGNTPLLVWVSVLRALLMRSASFVKLPSGPAAEWGRLFLRSFTELSPSLASGVFLAQWPGGTRALDATLCRNADLVLAYGGPQTIALFKAHCSYITALLAYGHRVSFGVAPFGTSLPDAAQGFARDVLLYDQGGCLSPHTIFVEGDRVATGEFGARLAAALAQVVVDFPQAVRTPQAALRVREARSLARMEPATTLWEDPDLRWTVVARPAPDFVVSPTHGVVSVQPLTQGVPDLALACAPAAGMLQGCAIADGWTDQRIWREALENLGVSWVCRPGGLQAPPFSWREDQVDVLGSLQAHL